VELKVREGLGEEVPVHIAEELRQLRGPCLIVQTAEEAVPHFIAEDVVALFHYSPLDEPADSCSAHEIVERQKSVHIIVALNAQRFHVL